MNLAEILDVYLGSDGQATATMYKKLEIIRPLGPIGLNLFRAVKTSERAKAYRKGPGHKTASYERKDWSIGNAADIMAAMNEQPFLWGWAIDPKMQERGDPHYHVIYFDLPTGQISFHCSARRNGPDYAGKWDGVEDAAGYRICTFVASIFAAKTGQ